MFAHVIEAFLYVKVESFSAIVANEGIMCELLLLCLICCQALMFGDNAERVSVS